MTDLTPEQIAARQANGEFGTHDHSDPEVELDGGNAYRDVTSPLTVTVRLEQWEGDYAREVGRVELDARALFDARKLADVDPETTDSDEDWVFYDAQAAGLLDEHEGPFTVELPDDFAEYIEHRQNNGMVKPYEGAAESLAIQVREAKLDKRRAALATAARLLQEAGDGATITKKVTELESGDVLVRGEYRTLVESASVTYDYNRGTSSYAVEVDFGTLYLDEDETLRVEAE